MTDHWGLFMGLTSGWSHDWPLGLFTRLTSGWSHDWPLRLFTGLTSGWSHDWPLGLFTELTSGWSHHWPRAIHGTNLWLVTWQTSGRSRDCSQACHVHDLCLVMTYPSLTSNLTRREGGGWSRVWVSRRAPYFYYFLHHLACSDHEIYIFVQRDLVIG